jgi:hypothetical protein
MVNRKSFFNNVFQIAKQTDIEIGFAISGILRYFC